MKLNIVNAVFLSPFLESWITLLIGIIGFLGFVVSVVESAKSNFRRIY
jgi:hypothetical protein